jgi:hypothetical protein
MTRIGNPAPTASTPRPLQSDSARQQDVELIILGWNPVFELLPKIFRSRKPPSAHTEVVLRWLLAHSG